MLPNWITEKGYRVGLNIMHIYSLKPAKILKISSLASKSQTDVLYFADSLGNLNSNEVREIVNLLKTHWKGDIGFHAHDSTRAALANTLEAIKCGVKWVDSTITGMGRGAGNLITEEFLIEANKIKNNATDIVPLLKIASEVFEPQRKYIDGEQIFSIT